MPRLVRAGHDVVVVSRGKRDPYTRTEEWEGVARVEADRRSEEKEETFAKRIVKLRPDAVGFSHLLAVSDLSNASNTSDLVTRKL